MAGVTFDVNKSVELEKADYDVIDLHEFLQAKATPGSKVLLTTKPEHAVRVYPENGFVGAALRAYNNHHHLVISPDDVWVTILSSFSRFMESHAEAMRSTFVTFEGKKELTVVGGGSITSANYDQLIEALTVQIDKNVKEDVKQWAECGFTTSTKTTKLVSRIALMGIMKQYFSYKMCLMCGLPRVTLRGTKDDWVSLRTKAQRFATWKQPELVSWTAVLEDTLNHFVDAFDSKVDTDFWDRIALNTGGGSGPTYVNGWILSFVAFDEKGTYFLQPLEKIKKTNNYGELDMADLPPATVEVPVIIDDNGREYKTKFVGGCIVATCEDGKISPSVDWSLIDVTSVKSEDAQ